MVNETAPHATARDWKRGNTLSFASSLLSIYPRQTAMVLLAFIVAGLMEGIGVTSFLPLLTVLTDDAAQKSGIIYETTQRVFSLVGMTPAVGPMLVLIVVLLSAKAVISLLAMRKVGNVTASLAKNLRMRLIQALLRAQWRHFKSLPVGKSANAIGTEAQRAAGAYMNFCRALADSTQVLIYIGLALYISWQITVGAVAIGFLIIFGLKRLISMARSAGQQQTHLLSSILARMTDALAGVKTIKTMGREAFFENVLAQEVRQLAAAQQREFMASQLLTVAREPVIAIFLAIGLYMATTWTDTPVSTLLVLAFMFFRVVTKLTTIQSNYQRSAALESAHFSLLDAIEEAEKLREVAIKDGAPPPQIKKEICFDNVCFAYDEDAASEDSAQVLSNINITLPAHAFNVVIGPSGTGKTTLVDLLVRLYDPTQGKIMVDGTPLDTIDLAAWRHTIGYLPQECPLFHDTVFQNIALGDPEIDRDRVIAALKQAGAWEFLSTLPDGIDTVVGERGSRFSGGQRQRIAIARALAGQPKILLLDEPTSALDEETEKQLLETVRELAGDITVIAITHNPGVTAYADHVFRIEKGKIEKA